MKSETLHTQEDILKMLDSLLRPAVPFWNEFYTNREKDVPFFANVPDENLVSYIQKEMDFKRESVRAWMWSRKKCNLFSETRV